MLRLGKIFMLQCAALLTLLFFALSIAGYYTLRSIEISHARHSLERVVTLLEEGLVSQRPADLRTLARKLHIHITLLDDHAKLLFTTQNERNLIARREIQEAIKDGWGEELRYDESLGADMLYIARRMDGKIVRLAEPLERVGSDYLTMWSWMFGLYLLSLLVLLVVARKNERRIEENVEQLRSYLRSLEEREYERSFPVDFAREFVLLKEQIGALASRLKKREAKKEKYAKKLKKISRQRNEIVSAISHEFKNPVAIINGYAQTLLEDPDMPPKLRQRFIQKIYNASSKIAAMIDRLALAMKFENENLTLSPSRFDMCEVAKEAVELLEQKYPKREIELECHESIVQADRAMIEVAMSNLIDNALKYSELPVKVTVRDGEFCVEDRGIGLEPQDLEKITKKFYRVRNSWDNSMGLGLYIVSYILKLHNTKLEIESEYRRGSRFCFRLEKR